MFTGLVEATGEVLALTPRGESARLTVRAPFSREVREGESIAVNGCCLTATAITAETIAFDLLHETLKRTNLGSASTVNLERALAANARLGGHFVQGHIDGTAEVRDFSQHGADWRLEIALAPDARGYVVAKGSIAVDGISLTVAEVSDASFVCWIIPHTRTVTNLTTRRVGDRVNLEYDLLAKYVERLLAVRG